MCIAILNTKKAGQLPKSQIKNSWDNNNMGAGLLWTDKKGLNVFKSYDYDAFLDKYIDLRKDESVGNIVLHFRIATSGYKGEHNLHPFLVNNNLGFVHNGVISGLGSKEFSDTYEFNDMLKKFGHNFIECEMTNYFISSYIGSSKLVFLDSSDKYSIINEHLGHWKDDNWYSNDSYKEYKDYVYYGNTKVNKSSTAKKSYVTYELDEFDEWNKSFKSPYSVSREDFDSDWEWEIYEDVCRMYGIEPEDDYSIDEVEYYMENNGCETIEDLWVKLYGVE
jgi:hypothetical protein